MDEEDIKNLSRGHSNEYNLFESEYERRDRGGIGGGQGFANLAQHPGQIFAAQRQNNKYRNELQSSGNPSYMHNNNNYGNNNNFMSIESGRSEEHSDGNIAGNRAKTFFFK